MKLVVKLLKNLGFDAAVIAMLLTVGLPSVGMAASSTIYKAIVLVSYLATIILILSHARIPEIENHASKKYAGLRPKKYYVALAAAFVLAFGLPIIGVPSGTLLWVAAVAPVTMVGIYFGLKELKRYINDTNNQIIIDEWGRDLPGRSIMAQWEIEQQG